MVSTLDFDSNIPGSIPGDAAWSHKFLPPRGVTGNRQKVGPKEFEALLAQLEERRSYTIYMRMH